MLSIQNAQEGVGAAEVVDDELVVDVLDVDDVLLVVDDVLLVVELEVDDVLLVELEVDDVLLEVEDVDEVEETLLDLSCVSRDFFHKGNIVRSLNNGVQEILSMGTVRMRCGDIVTPENNKTYEEVLLVVLLLVVLLLLVLVVLDLHCVNCRFYFQASQGGE
jgi:hypothetical protein